MVSSPGGASGRYRSGVKMRSGNEPLGRSLLRGGGEVRVDLVSTGSLLRFWHERVRRALIFTLGGRRRFEPVRGLGFAFSPDARPRASSGANGVERAAACVRTPCEHE